MFLYMHLEVLSRVIVPSCLVFISTHIAVRWGRLVAAARGNTTNTATLIHVPPALGSSWSQVNLDFAIWSYRPFINLLSSAISANIRYMLP